MISCATVFLAVLGCSTAALLNSSCPNEGLRLLQRSTSNQKVLASSTEDPLADPKRLEDARFLIQASFGPTLASLDAIHNISYRDWIAQQISLPIESHREYYRKRVNPRTAGDPVEQLHSGSARPKCRAGSRWVNYVLLASDEEKPIAVQDNKIYVDGVFRSDVDPSYAGNGLLHPTACSDKAPDNWDVTCAAHAHKMSYSCKYQSWKENMYCQQTCYDQGVGYEGYDCSPGWPGLSGLQGYICEVFQEAVGAWVLLSSVKDCNQDLLAVSNPRVWRTYSSPEMLASSVEIMRPGILLLSSQADCNLGNVLQSDIEVAGGFYMFEERLELAENTLAAPASSESWIGGSCPSVPRSFLNEDHCLLLPGCRPLGASNLELELKTSTLETFFSQAGRYVYAIRNLRVQMSPCGALSRWQKLDCTETCTATSLDSSQAELIAAKLQSSSGFLRDIEVSCQGVPASAVVLVGSSYFQHVHKDEYNVYDFTDWVFQHPGGPDKITQWANMGFELEFPSWHPMERWEEGIAAEVIRPNFVGKYSTVVQFQDLPQPLQTQQVLVAMGADVAQEELSAVCGSPGEVANDPREGHQLSIMHGDDLRDNDFDLDHAISNQHSKSTAWTMKALHAKDQLRQRMAWALSQIFVAASTNGIGFNDRNEMWLNFYDIFVRNAFGNFRQILREVTYSPIMGDYLTYEGNRAFDSLGSYPDENYAREIMQLFSIGLWKLNPDGSRKLDAQNESIPTYSNEHIMNFARVFTGFDEQPKRANVEEVDSHNYIDPMQMKANWHDVYPKPDLNEGFLGDGYPLCSDLPKHAYLRAGSKFEFLGHSYSHEGLEEFHVSETSGLYQALCLSPGKGLPCRFNLTVELNRTLPCHAAECQAHAVRILHVGTGYYEYVPPTCVDLFFYNGQTTDHGESRRRSKVKCMNPKQKVAGTACCKGCTNTATGWMKDEFISCENATTTWPSMFTKRCNFRSNWADRSYCQLACWEQGVGYEGDNCSFGAWRGEQVCTYLKEPVLFATAEQRCQDLGLDICDVGLPGYGCEFDKMPVWKSESCSYEVIVQLSDGKVSFDSSDKARLNKFWVPWSQNAYPGSEGTCPSGCSALLDGTGCSCGMEVEEVVAFEQTPSEEELVSRLKIAAYPPNGTCTLNCSDAVRAYLTGTSIDSTTVFEHNGRFYKNIEALVHVGSFSFRNPPAFISSEEPLSRQALAEVESLLDHLAEHENTAVFISHRLIQRLVTSNPSPEYIESVANAFKTGSYDGTVYSGQYGDLAATVAAILLEPEARSQDSESNGLLREPLLKLIHFLRSMQYEDKAGRPVVIDNLMERIGQWPFQSESVFNFYSPDFAPDAFPGDLVAPEFEIFTPPLAINFANGMMSLIDNGLGSCEEGFGEGSCTQGVLTLGELECVQPTIEQLDLLLTGGRLSSKDTVKAAYLQAAGADQYKALQKAIVMSPEFHSLGSPMPGQQRSSPAVEETSEALRPYKAMVMLFLNGGADTFNMLVPLNCGLYDEYRQIRSSVALTPEQLHQISTEGQACADFGIHQALPFMKELYDLGQASFVSNVGALLEPLTKEAYKGQGSRCAGLFSHSDQRRAAQTLTCQSSTASSRGAGGRIADALALGTHGFRTNSFSVAGSNTWPQGMETAAEIIDKNSGAVRLQQYNQLKTVIENMTSVQHGNVYCEEYAKSFAKAIDFNEELAAHLRNSELLSDFQTPNGLAEQLKQVARLMVAHEERKVERDLFFVSIGGFDTHQDVFEELADKFQDINEALSYFVGELKAQGLFNSMVLVTHSDFGRTLTPNSGEGTDHAWAGNHIILGGALRGGRVLNEFPESLLAESLQDAGRGRLIPKYPWESVMVPVARWLGVEESQESSVFPNIANFNRSLHIIGQADLFQ